MAKQFYRVYAKPDSDWDSPRGYTDKIIMSGDNPRTMADEYAEFLHSNSNIDGLENYWVVVETLSSIGNMAFANLQYTDRIQFLFTHLLYEKG